MAILQKGPKDAKKHTLATAAPFDTLESIAKKNSIEGGWEALALYLFGTTDADEVNRGISETIGAAKVNLAHAEKTQLKSMEGHDGKIPLPEVYTDNTFVASNRYRLTVQKTSAPTAISITNLDKWFIPGMERNDIRYSVEGDLSAADRLDFSVYGSNYCECTDWGDGFGKYKIIEDEPVFNEQAIKVAERVKSEVLNVTGADGKKNAWDGFANTQKGIFATKTDEVKDRFINVAFSPYTVHLRYRKNGEDSKAQLAIEPFWPKFEETKSEPAVTKNFAASPATFSWTNSEDQYSGVLEVFDAEGQRVHVQKLSGKALEKGAQSANWNKLYPAGVTNGKFKGEYIDDAAEDPNLKKLLFRSTPYNAKVTTYKRKVKADSLKIKWEVKNTSKLERGLLIITSTRKSQSGEDIDEVVFQKVLKKDELSSKKHEFAWDGKYLPGVKNSKARDSDPANKVYEIIPEDMPYRLQIQAHTKEGVQDGLALAAMHTEVRLYVHPGTSRPDEPSYDSSSASPSMLLGLNTLVPGEAPKAADGTKWYRYQLAQAGFHPGPVTDDASAKKIWETSLAEFKRSVPADGSATSPDFKRLDLSDGSIHSENADTKKAIETLRDSDRRNWFGDLSRVLANNDKPDYDYPSTKPADLQNIEAILSDVDKDVVVWADDHQYNTSGLKAVGFALDAAGNNFYDGETAGTDAQKKEAISFALNNHRGTMDNGDKKTVLDEKSIPRPWIPLKAVPVLLSRTEDLQGNKGNKTGGLDIGSLEQKRRDAMRGLIGPLRIDWTFEDLPADVSVINPAGYDPKFSRTRKYVAWALRKHSGKHTRKDTKRETVFANAKKDFGGIRPDTWTEYYKAPFGVEKLSLEPWKAFPEKNVEAVSTVVHDLLLAKQANDKNHYSKLVGASGVFFNPSNIAGDGYRIRAEVQFDKFSSYEFPNLDRLKNRYETPPQAHSARLRVWRRSAIRGYACWAPAATGHWPALVNGFRDHYRPSHVYFVHEGRDSPRPEIDITNVYTEADFKSIISKNILKSAWAGSPAFAPYWNRAVAGDASRMSLDQDTTWPWSHHGDMGWQWPSPLYTYNEFAKWIDNTIHSVTWRVYREALIIGILRQVEKQGVLRGHLFVEFESSPKCDYEAYQCANCAVADKYYWYLRKSGSAAGAKAGTQCPQCGAGNTINYIGEVAANSTLPWAAVGSPLGATWLFTSSDADTWAHEVGHHRHFIHCASAPGSHQNPGDPPAPSQDQHDKEQNSTQDWGALQTAQGNDKGTKATERDWDRNCIMSYSGVYYGPTVRGTDYFCGKCVLRQSGWKVTNLGYPGTDIIEP